MSKRKSKNPANADKQARRYAILTEKALEAGYTSWAAYCTAVINCEVKIAKKENKNGEENIC